MRQYVVDAFSEQVFGGNPAAVCLPERWLSAEQMLLIAQENNLSETAFAVRREPGVYDIRWFTPGGEVDLCGHATLATSFVIFNFAEPEVEELLFHGQSGDLRIRRKGALYEMNLPVYPLKQVAVTPEMCAAIGAEPKEAWLGRDLLCLFESEQVIRGLQPDQEKLKEIPGLLLQATAPGDKEDCVSRSFGPKLHIPEDPVCGSGHCHIVPFWAERLGRDELVACQASARGGILYCRVMGDRIAIAGKAALYSIAEISTGPDDPVQV